MLRAGAIVASVSLASLGWAGPGALGTGQLPLVSQTKVQAHRTDTRFLFPPLHHPAVVGPAWGTAPLRPALGFEGLGSVGAFPANCDVALGPTDVVQVVNGQIAFYTREGAQTFLSGAAAFFSGLAETAEPDQPRVEYDPTTSRFYLLFSEHDDSAMVSNYLLAVSDDSDPHGGWFLYKISSWRSVGMEQAWCERPALGYNDGGIFLTGTYRQHLTGNPTGGAFFVMPKAPLLAGGSPQVSVFFDMNRNWVQSAACPGSPLFAFAGTMTAPNAVRVYGAKHPETGSPLVQFIDQTAINSPLPPATAASTDGGLLETNGPSAMSAAWADDRFYLANNIGGTGGVCAVRWRAYDTSNFVGASLPHIMSGVVSLTGTNVFQPAMAVNVHSDAVVLCSASSGTVTSDVVTAGRVVTDPITAMSSPFVAASGEGSPYVDTRWGTAFGACMDPLDGEAFWGTAMVVRSDGEWTTRVFSWYVSRTWPALPTAFSLFRGQLLSGGLASLQADDGDYLVARKGVVLNASEPPIQLVVDGTAPSGQVLSVGLEVAAKVNTPGLSQRVQFFNWGTGVYDTVATGGATVSESLQVAAATGAGTAYVQSGTGAVRARAQWFQSGIVINNAWSASVDLVRWKIRTR